MRHAINLSLLLTLVGCFDFSATPFGTEGFRCDVGSVCEPGLVCDASDHCINPCKDIRCSGHGTCQPLGVSPSCVCDGGFAPVDLECLEIGTINAPCGPSSTCASGLTCVGGVCVDACSLLTCAGHGDCQLIGTAPSCVCDPGYHPAISTCVDDCTGENCSGHGVCTLVDKVATCGCETGFSPSGLACVADACVPNGTMTVVCETGHLYDVDSCDRRVSVRDACGARGCSGTSCNAVTWAALGTSAYDPWTTFKDLSTVDLSGLSRSSGGSFNPTIALDVDSRPVVAWQDNLNGALAVYTRRWSGAAWLGPDLGAGSDLIPGSLNITPSVVVTTQNQPVLAWIHDPDETPPAAYVRAWNGSSWSELGGSGSGDGINPTSAGVDGIDVALLPNQNPVVVWSQQAQSTGRYNIYAKQWSGTAWVEIGSGSASGNGLSATTAILSTDPSIVVDASGRVSIAWLEGPAVIVASYINGSWTRLGTNASSSSVSTPHLAVDEGGILYVVWQSSPPGENYEVFARRWIGGTWTDMGPLARVSNTTNSSWEPDVATSSDGHVFVAWAESMSNGFSGGAEEIFVREWTGESWSEFPIGSASGRGISNDSAESRVPTIAVDGMRVCVTWQSNYTGTNGPQNEIYARCATR